jgi:hypothetical protein
MKAITIHVPDEVDIGDLDNINLHHEGAYRVIEPMLHAILKSGAATKKDEGGPVEAHKFFELK